LLTLCRAQFLSLAVAAATEVTQPGAGPLKANSVTSEVSKRAVHATDGDFLTEVAFKTSSAKAAK